MIALSAGHYPNSPGVCYRSICEHGEASIWVSILTSVLRDISSICVVPSVRLKDKISWINAHPEIKLVCEIHFNSDESKKAAGSETLYAPNSVKGRECARLIQAEMAGIFLPNRGYKEGWYKMIRPPNPAAVPDALLAKTKPVAIIVEPEFIYNYQMIEDRRIAGCNSLAKGLLKSIAYLELET